LNIASLVSITLLTTALIPVGVIRQSYNLAKPKTCRLIHTDHFLILLMALKWR